MISIGVFLGVMGFVFILKEENKKRDRVISSLEKARKAKAEKKADRENSNSLTNDIKELETEFKNLDKLSDASTEEK